MNGWNFFGAHTLGMLVVVFNRYLTGVAIDPDKADTPLVIDPNTVFSISFPRKSFEMITRWGTKIVDRNGGMKHEKFPVSPALYVHGQLPRWFPLEQSLSFFIRKALDHNELVSYLNDNGSRY